METSCWLIVSWQLGSHPSEWALTYQAGSHHTPARPISIALQDSHRARKNLWVRIDPTLWFRFATIGRRAIADGLWAPAIGRARSNLPVRISAMTAPERCDKSLCLSHGDSPDWYWCKTYYIAYSNEAKTSSETERRSSSLLRHFAAQICHPRSLRSQVHLNRRHCRAWLSPASRWEWAGRQLVWWNRLLSHNCQRMARPVRWSRWPSWLVRPQAFHLTFGGRTYGCNWQSAWIFRWLWRDSTGPILRCGIFQLNLHP